MARPGFHPRASVAARRARVLQMRIEQIPYLVIAAELGISESAARVDYHRALEQGDAEQAALSPKARYIEQVKLDAQEREAWRVLRNRHITIQQGKIVRDEVGGVIEDDAPVLQAIDRLLRIAARRATLTGMDAPARVEVSDATDAEIQRLAAELAVAAGVGDVEPGGEAAAPGDPPRGQERTPAP